jgi:aspartyl-tRNA(Asn)/glutamyl-tRNA(Gln) amidotransferase subunit A
LSAALDVAGLREAVRTGRATAEATVRRALDAIAAAEAGGDGLHAFLAVADGAALDAARAVDAAIAAGRPAGRLAGVPIAIKDNICTTDLPTTCASRILAGYRSPFEATVVRRLRAEGAVVVGKTNMDEFGMGSSTENSAYGPTRNPHDRGRVPGGSSGGSAAAVAAGLVRVALGSETGGSVRQPAAFCGVVGLKPGYGRVSRYGLVAFASSLDQIGVFGASVADAAAVLEVIAGPDPLDSTCADRPAPALLDAVEADVRGLVVGLPAEYFPVELDARVAERCHAAADRLRALGATVRPVSLPHTRYAIPTYYVLATAEASSNLARYDGVRYGVRAPEADSTAAVYEASRSLGFGAEVKRRIMLGTYVLSAGYHEAYYGRAQRVRRLIAADFEAVFAAGVHAVLTPTTPTPAFRLGEKTDDPYTMYLSDVFTVTANLAALPAVSVPAGTVDGLPVGVQLLGARGSEPVLVALAAALERSGTA